MRWELIFLFGGAVAWPPAEHTQGAALPIMGDARDQQPTAVFHITCDRGKTVA
jgi:hypothetical protein